jgi:hypothetical protein
VVAAVFPAEGLAAVAAERSNGVAKIADCAAYRNKLRCS